MTLLCKNKALYVKACIIQNGIADTDGDILNTTDIKKIFTSFNNQNSFEIHHNELPINEVSLMENYISKTDENIANTVVPAGSWNCIIRVDNPNIQDKLLSYEFGGVSLNNRVREECALNKNLSGEVTYAEVGDMECMIPLFISFVSEPANRVGLEIMDYTAYIEKNKKKTLIKSNSKILKSDKMNWIEKLKGIIAEAEAEAAEEVETKEEPTDEADTVEVTDDVEIEKEETTDEKEKEEEEEDAEVEKAETTETETDAAEVEITDETAIAEEDRIAALENRIQVLEDKVNELTGLENTIDQEVNPENATDEPLITKSSKIDVTEINTIEVGNDFYTATHRDPVTGKRIRNKTKILN